MKKISLKKYKNPSRKCQYPFELNLLGYCWSYANYVDGDQRFKNIKEICRTCEMFKRK